MIRHIYIEQMALDHPRTDYICQKFANAKKTVISSFSEVFNPKNQNFRLQKDNPAAIIGHKHGNRVLPIPPEYALGAKYNYYFSHGYNCLYDCRYCFLQAMYSSANYVFFVNYEDFIDDIKRYSDQHSKETVYFFSGYDCDSLAFEPITGFAKKFVEVFKNIDNAVLELRTKSTAIQNLLAVPPVDNVVVAFSLSPDVLAQLYEHRAPSVSKRLDAIRRLADHGWNIGLRFDPLIWHANANKLYKQLCEQVFAILPEKLCHSVTIGSMRFPHQQHRRLIRLYPEERLFATVELQKNMVGYPPEIEQDLLTSMRQTLTNYVDGSRIYLMS